MRLVKLFFIWLVLLPGILLHAQDEYRAEAFRFVREMGRGANFMAAKVEGQYFDEMDAIILETNHFTHIRLGAKMNDHIGQGPGYEIDQARITYMKEAVDILLEHGLMVIIDPLHQYNETYTDNDLPVLKSMWLQLAEAFAGYPVDRVAFEIMNEPHADYNLFSLVNESLKVIRSVEGNQERIVIVSGQGFSTRQALINAFNDNVFPTDDPYIVGTFHYYDPRSFTKQGSLGTLVNWADGGDEDTDWTDVSAAFNEVNAANAAWAERNETTPLPLYLGEFGGDNAAPLADRKR